MKFSLISATITAAGLVGASPTKLEARASGVQGFDISSYQSSVDFSAAYSSGTRFVIIKASSPAVATEGTSYIDSSFSDHYTAATNAGLIRGGYHFAHPDASSGSTQASYFLKHGGGWSNDGITLPGMLDLEYNPSGDTCYGLSASSMVSWIQDFASTYHSETGRYPMVYSTADWWNTCTGGSTAFKDTSPLVLARYSSSGPGTIPGGWPYQTIWQNSDSYSYGGDSDIFNGDEASLKKLASG
ncbi:N,O-diacetyl muramidase, putative [Paecilomyces variotii No. 5]|uniref:N,O-diacetylmuramidase n=1 Tax=Byssochlamys spectabilis (strain No. 5 / NBRC 109023) TaxID=1356009 RepID=V5FBK5_BYSSN|nr:N,O-diacetyl muramidase, putative [Paecilomyces variotii No. 5]